MIVVYDKTFDGFLTVVFDYYKDLLNIEIRSEDDQLSFLDMVRVGTDRDKADRVKASIKKNLSKGFYKDIITAFNSSNKDKDIIIAKLIKLAFLKGIEVVSSANKYAISFNKMVKNFRSEAHSLKGLLRFREIQEGYLFAEYESNNFILGDLSYHFLKRMPDEKFIIYDKNSGKAFVSIYGNFEVVDIIDLNIEESSEEEFFRSLWLGFYDAISIKERENKKLMISNMPKRYWKYLPEKNRIK